VALTAAIVASWTPQFMSGAAARGLWTVLAGIGYGWIYASTRSLVGAVAAHAGLNTMHLLFFTYPALRAALAS
jgi:membrane protease YdiL (CAAX protease family)